MRPISWVIGPFSKMLLKIKYAILRFLFAFFSVSAVLSGGLTAYLFGPLFSWYFFSDLNCTKYYKYIHPVIFAYLRFLFRSMRDSEYGKGFAVPFTATPRVSPSAEALRIKGSWTGPLENCDGCIDCCEKVRCPLLDTEKNNCLSYGSFYWKYFSCGRYPVNRFQAAYYECPKWEFGECL